MANAANPARSKALLQQQLDRIPRLRGTGPNPFDYDMWEARTEEIVTAAFGEASDEHTRYQEQVGKRGRLPGVRGPAENMTLNIHGQWGILNRLGRAETLLKEFTGKL